MSMTKWYAPLWAVVRSWRKRSGPRAAGHALPEETLHRFDRGETYGLIGPIVTQGVPGQDDWRMRLCRCSVCAQVRLCTPDFDFYATHQREGLMCHDCFYQLVVDAQHRGIQA